MFSAFKRLTNKLETVQNGQSESGRPPGHQSMSSTLQRKFAKGIQYNMKIVIKGDRNVGKTCLFHRLQGKKFVEEYLPTEEIQVTSIHWNYKATDDVVKVEVWDVVDKGKKKKHFEGLKLDNSQLEIPEQPALDAEFLDVYKGTNGVILMMDITKSWTFDYVQRELPKIPVQIPVIILANHCDMSHHRTITTDHVLYYIESLSGKRNYDVRYAESSMRNSFGLKILHKFFNIPFLQLQRQSILQQLERNAEETNATIQELEMYCDSDEADYNKFLENLTKKRRETADGNANIPPPQTTLPNPVSGGGHIQSPDSLKRSQSGPIVIGAGKPIPFSINNASVQKSPNSSGSQVVKSTSHSSGFVSKKDETGSLDSKRPDPITSVDEFCPDGGLLDKNFLEDVQGSPQNANVVVDSDSEEDRGNPLVSEYQDDFEGDIHHHPNSESHYVPSIKMDRSAPDDYEGKPTNDELDATINSEISEITSEAFDTWMAADTKWRQSPEGGEDISTVSQTLDYSSRSAAYDDTTSVTSSVHMEMLLSKHEHSYQNSDSEEGPSMNASLVKRDKKKEKADKKGKQKKKDKDKSKDKSTKSERKHKKHVHEERSSSHRDELEEFLNGSPPGSIADSAYEAI